MSVTDILRTMEYGPAPEAADPALRWIADRTPFGHLINGQWTEDGEHF